MKTTNTSSARNATLMSTASTAPTESTASTASTAGSLGSAAQEPRERQGGRRTLSFALGCASLLAGLAGLCGCSAVQSSSVQLRERLPQAFYLQRRELDEISLAKAMTLYCLERAEEDEAAAKQRSDWDVTLITTAAVSGTLGAVAGGVNGALDEDSRKTRRTMVVSSAGLVALTAGILGLRTALNLNEQVIVRREATARRKRAAARIASSTDITANVEAFSDCIQEDLLVAKTGPTAPAVGQALQLVRDAGAREAEARARGEAAAGKARTSQSSADAAKEKLSVAEAAYAQAKKAGPSPESVAAMRDVRRLALELEGFRVDAADAKVAAADEELRASTEAVAKVLAQGDVLKSTGLPDGKEALKRQVDAANLERLRKSLARATAKLDAVKARIARETTRQGVNGRLIEEAEGASAKVKEDVKALLKSEADQLKQDNDASKAHVAETLEADRKAAEEEVKKAKTELDDAEKAAGGTAKE